MPTLAPINSSAIVIRISADGITYDIVGFISNATMTTTLATRDITTKLSCGWRELGEGMRSWAMSGDGLLTFTTTTGEVDFKSMFTYFNERTKLYVDLTTWDCAAGDIGADDPNYSGQAYLTSLELSGGVEDNATASFTLEGTGVLTEAINP